MSDDSESDPISTHEIYGAIGHDGLARICDEFYRQVPDDDILGPMYPESDMDGAHERLLQFLVYRFGGPQDYIEKRGHPRLRGRHMPFKIDQAARDRWMKIMRFAIEQAEIPAAVAAALDDFFDQTASFMINQ